MGKEASVALPPQDLAAEESVLGSILLDCSFFDQILEILKGDDFYRSAHRKIFQGMVSLDGTGDPIDIVTLANALKNRGELDEVGGQSYLAALRARVTNAGNVIHHAKIVHDKSVRRNLIAISNETIVRCLGEESTDFLLDTTESQVFNISEKRSRQSIYRLNETIFDALRVIERAIEKKELITGLSTGLVDLDRITSGLQPSDLIILAARPGMGKTALAITIAQNVAIRSNISVLVFSLEMSKEQLNMRLLCSEARVDAGKVKTGYLTDKEIEHLIMVAGVLGESPIFIDDTPAQTIVEIRAKARRVKKEASIGLVIVDYLQLVSGSLHHENRVQEIAEVSRGLKTIAKELNIPVLALSQLNRQVEQRADKRPIMSDIRDCITGDTLVALADGRQVPVRELVGTEPYVLAVDGAGRVKPARSDRVWKVGIRPVFTIRLTSGRSIRATKGHRLLGVNGWIEVGKLSVHDRLGVIGKAMNETSWDQISAIEPVGEEEVYDITVPGPASWIGNGGIVNHNSGSVEQDGDVVMFIYRDDVYNPDSDKEGAAEVIVSKQRNGPTGTATLAFRREYTRFDNLIRMEGQYAKGKDNSGSRPEPYSSNPK